jgi:hypothetical protein
MGARRRERRHDSGRQGNGGNDSDATVHARIIAVPPGAR